MRHMALTKDRITELILEAPDYLDAPVIEFDEDARRAWAKIVNPHRFVMIPDYMLKSWIPTLGASKTLVALAFRQVAYISKCKDLIGEEIAEASIEQLSRWSGLSVGGVHKILSDPGYLTWFVRGIGSKSDEAGNIYADRDRRSYRVRIDIPLTPEDQYKLRCYLEAHAPAEDNDWPLVLFEAPKARKAKAPKKAALPETPKTIQEIVKELRGIDRPLTRQIDEACVELYDQWVQPGFFGRATHYFINRWVPELSSSIACLILWARRRAYLDSHLEEVRFMRLESNKDLASAIGVSDRTIRRIKTDPLSSLFLSFSDEEHQIGILEEMENGFVVLDGKRFRLSPSFECDEGLSCGETVRLVLEKYNDGPCIVLRMNGAADGAGESQRKQAVRMRVRASDPIHPDDWKRYETLLGLEDREELWSAVNMGWTNMNEAWSKVNDGVDKSEYGQEVNEIMSKVNLLRPEMNDPLTEVKSVMTDLNDSLSEVNTFKESLNTVVKELNNKSIKQPQQDQVVVVHNKGWNIESILRNGAVKKGDRQLILNEWIARGIDFIAHLLFGMSQETITSPVLFAASRFLGREEPASEFLDLAHMDPVSLVIELRRASYSTGWGGNNSVMQLAQNSAYDQLTRLEAFDFNPDFWEDDSFDEEEVDEQDSEQYAQLSFIEKGSVDTSAAEDLWEKVKDQLQKEIPRANYENWVKQAVGVDYDENVLTIGVENEHARDWLEDRLSSTVRRVVTGINARASEVRFIVI